MPRVVVWFDFSSHKSQIWLGWMELNHLLIAYKTITLTNELQPKNYLGKNKNMKDLRGYQLALSQILARCPNIIPYRDL